MDLEDHIDHYSMVPDEIFIQIFRLLPLEDRNSIRLTCRRFYKLCDDSLIQSAEVFLLRGTLNTVPALHCLSRSNRRIQNIKLRHMYLNTATVLPFFEQHGPHLRSLILIYCSFGKGAMKAMIERCIHLRYLAVVFIWNGLPTVLNDLDDLAHNSIVRDSVTELSLLLTLNADIITNQNILDFFALFPRIRKLTLDIRGIGNWRPAYVLSNIKSSVIGRCLLAVADQLEVLDWCFVDGVPNDFFNVPMKNLKQLNLSWFEDVIPSMYYSSHFERLPHFSCWIAYSYKHIESGNLSILRLLQLSSLQSLIIDTCFIDRQLFKALVESKLRSLEIRDINPRRKSLSKRDLKETHPLSLKNTLKPNYCLQHLCIDSGDRVFKLLFATYFRSVDNLDIFVFDEGFLQNIFNDRTNVRYLRVCNLTSDNCFKELSYFQDCLQKAPTINRELRDLTELRIRDGKYSLTGFFLDEFVLPQLKKLNLHFWHKLDEHEAEQLCHLISKLPQLQSLHLDSRSEMSYSQWLTVCKGSTKLRNLYVTHNVCTFFTSSEYIRLFDVSHSLRIITHKAICTPETKNFVYDVIEKTVIYSPESHLFEDDGGYVRITDRF